MTAPVPAAAAPSAPASSVNRRVLGGLLLVFGTSWMLKQANIVSLSWTAVLSLVLIALGLALVITARARMNSVPLLLLGAGLTASLAIGTSDIHLKGGFGERTYLPVAIQRGTTRFDHFAGDVTFDFRRTTFTGEHRTVTAEVTFGKMVVRLPPNVAFDINVEMNFGEATILGERHDFKPNDDPVHVETDNYNDAEIQKVRLYLKSFAGEIQVFQ